MHKVENQAALSFAMRPRPIAVKLFHRFPIAFTKNAEIKARIVAAFDRF
jgi:hypothetical protein